MSQRRCRAIVLVGAAAACAALAVAAAVASPAMAMRSLPRVGGLVSPTHPLSDHWYSNASPTFVWADPVTSPSFAFSIDQLSSGDPGTDVSAGSTVTPDSTLFDPEAAFTLGAGPSPNGQAVATGDLNGDGVPDLVVAANYADTISVLDGAADGSLAAPVSYAMPTSSDLPDELGYYGPLGVTIADVNHDGWPDVVVDLDTYSGLVAVVLNNGDGTLGPWHTYETGGAYPSSVTVADVNGDGDPDLIAVNSFQWSSTVGVLLGNGDGTFQDADQPTTFSTDWNPSAVAVADVNGDGHPDIVTANNGFEGSTGNGSLTVLLGDGVGGFAAHVDAPLSARASSLALADLNGDGKLDAVVGEDGQVSVLLGNGDGTWQAPRDASVGSGAVTGLAVADFDRDGKADVAASLVGGAYLLSGGGDGSLADPVTVAGGYDPAIVTADFNSDGRADLAVADVDDSGFIGVLTAASPTVSVSEGPLADGTWYFHARAVDGAGKGGEITTLPVNIDTVAPTSTLGGLDDDWHSAGVIPVTIDASDPGYPASAGVSQLQLQALWGGEVVIPWKSEAGGNVVDGAMHEDGVWEGFPDGVWTLQMRAIDGAGNVETAHDYTIKQDTTAPTVALTGVRDGASYTTAQTAVLTATDPVPTLALGAAQRAQAGSFAHRLAAVRVREAAGGMAKGPEAPQMNSGVASVSYRAGHSGAFTTVAGKTASISIAASLAKQTYEYYATDAVGNASKTRSFTVTAVPAPPRAVAHNAAHVVRGGTAHLRYSLSDAALAKLSCRLFVTQYGKSKLSLALGDRPVGTTLDAAVRIALPLGCYTWHVRAHEAGGRTVWSNGRTLVVYAHNLIA
jgi:hypothetical protein